MALSVDGVVWREVLISVRTYIVRRLTVTHFSELGGSAPMWSTSDDPTPRGHNYCIGTVVVCVLVFTVRSAELIALLCRGRGRVFRSEEDGA